MKRVAIVNRFFPPDPAVTGESARELADFLKTRFPGIDVRILATKAKYAGGREVAACSHHHVDRLGTYYSGTNKAFRLASSIYDGIRLAWTATREADLVISLTDPPLLGLWLCLLVQWRRTHWIEWTMDLYPEAFVAADLLSPSNVLFLAMRRLLSRFRPAQLICLGVRQHAFVQQARGARIPAAILPCGILDVEPGPLPDWRSRHSDKLIIAYAGNLGEAHSLDVVEQLILRADHKRMTFLLALYGARAQELRQRLRNVPGVEWREHLTTRELAHVDVHLVSLTRKWTHICVPSKAVSAVSAGRPLIYAGVPDGDNWNLLSEAGWLIPERHDGGYSVDDIDRVLLQVTDSEARKQKTDAARELRLQLRRMRDEAFDSVAHFIEGSRFGASAELSHGDNVDTPLVRT